LRQGHSDALTAYLNRDEPFHNYSFGNILEICTAEAGRNPRCWPVVVEPAWTQGEEGREELRDDSIAKLYGA
jgi:hypothetical protein